MTFYRLVTIGIIAQVGNSVFMNPFYDVQDYGISRKLAAHQAAARLCVKVCQRMVVSSSRTAIISKYKLPILTSTE